MAQLVVTVVVRRRRDAGGAVDGRRALLLAQGQGDDGGDLVLVDLEQIFTIGFTIFFAFICLLLRLTRWLLAAFVSGF